MSTKKNKITDDPKQSKYYCNICMCSATSNTNLQIHCQSKKHIRNASEINSKTDKFYKEILDFRDNTQLVIDNYKKLDLIKSNYADIENSLKGQIDVILSTLTKTENDKNYICDGCKKIFKEKMQYKLHIGECIQLNVKHNLLKEVTIDLVIQLKQLQEACISKLKPPTVRTSAKDKKIKDLEDKVKSLTDENRKTQDIVNTLNSKCKKLKAAKETIFILNNDIRNLSDAMKTINFKNKILKEKCRALKSQNNTLNVGSNNVYNNSNKTNFQIIFNNSPPFEYVNPFKGPITRTSISKKFAEEKEVLLKDNHNQSEDIKSQLCNAVSFSNAYERKKLVDFVALAIIIAYVKVDASEQSIWNTDTTRSTYNIRIKNNKTNLNFWQNDKEGVTLKKILIRPILRYLEDVMNTYQQYCTQKHLGGKTEFEYPAPQEINDLYFKFINSKWEDLTHMTPEEIYNLSRLFCFIKQLKEYIQDPNFSKEVLKKMGSKFYFDKTKCLAQCSTEDERKAVTEEISKIEVEEKEEEIIEEINDSEDPINEYCYVSGNEIIEEIDDSKEPNNKYYYTDDSEIVEKSDYHSDSQSEETYESSDPEDKPIKKTYKNKKSNIIANRPFRTPFH